MAEIVKVKDINRPYGYSDAPTTGDTSVWGELDYLRVEFSYGTGASQRECIAVLPFADYAGIESEWTGNTTTGAITGACNTWLTSTGATGFELRQLSSTQDDVFGFDITSV